MTQPMDAERATARECLAYRPHRGAGMREDCLCCEAADRIARDRIATALATARSEGWRAGVEAAAVVAHKHKGAAERERRAKGFRSSEEIRAEERGEDIAAEIMEQAIRALAGPGEREGT